MDQRKSDHSASLLPGQTEYNLARNEDTQQEWLMQIAAGTDPLTGLAAVPREERPKRKSTVCLAAIVILGLSWLLVRWL